MGQLTNHKAGDPGRSDRRGNSRSESGSRTVPPLGHSQNARPNPIAPN